MSLSEARDVMQNLLEINKLDPTIVNILFSSIENIDKQRILAQSEATRLYFDFRQQML
jgi:hypothetical protein